MTQEALADCLAIDYSRLGKWERGVHKFPVDQLPLIAQALAEDIIFTKTGEIKIRKEVVSMQTIRTVLNAVQAQIESEVFGQEVSLQDILQGNCIRETNGMLNALVEKDERKKSFENTLYVNPEETMYLLESRLYDVETDQMDDNAYVELFHADLTPFEDYPAQIWTFQDWKVVD